MTKLYKILHETNSGIHAIYKWAPNCSRHYKENSDVSLSKAHILSRSGKCSLEGCSYIVKVIGKGKTNVEIMVQVTPLEVTGSCPAQSSAGADGLGAYQERHLTTPNQLLMSSRKP